MKIAVSSESTIDIQKDLLDKYEISVIPYGIFLGEKLVYDGNITNDELFEYTKKTGELPKTTAINEFTFEDYFKDLLKENDAVIHVCLSSGISSTFLNAQKAAERVGNVYVVDSKTLSSGIALLCIYARVLSKTMDDPKEIYNLVQKRADSLQVSFVIDTLTYLHKGGRCSSLSLFGANIFHIHPRIILKDGKMISDKKYHGNMDVVVKNYVKDTLEEYNNADKSLVFITYTTATEKMVEETKQALIEQGFENILISFANCTVTCHCGPNTLGILYFNDNIKTI